MPVQKKIAQMFIAAVPLIEDKNELFKVIKEYIDIGIGGLMIGVGGKIKFLETNGLIHLKKLKKFTEELKKLDPTLFLAIDGEGGELFNIFKDISPLKCAREYGLIYEKNKSLKEFQIDLDNYILSIKNSQINMNFTPVLDTAIIGYKGYMSEFGRAYSDKDETVKTLSNIFIRKMQENKIIAVGKHFPGYGNLSDNPHMKLKEINPSRDFSSKLKTSPYADAIMRGKLKAIMKGHVLSGLDKKAPATLSGEVDNYLRTELHFKGLSIADELFMGALNDYYANAGGDLDAAKRTVDAAKYNDLLIISYPKQEFHGRLKMNPTKHDHFQRLHRSVCKAVEKGVISKRIINNSYARIIIAKKWMMLKN